MFEYFCGSKRLVNKNKEKKQDLYPYIRTDIIFRLIYLVLSVISEYLKNLTHWFHLVTK